MKNETRLLMRGLSSDLDAEQRAALQERLRLEPELRAELTSLERSWRWLDEQGRTSVPLDLSGSIMEQVREQGSSRGFAFQGLGARAGAVACFLIGVLLGVGWAAQTPIGPLPQHLARGALQVSAPEEGDSGAWLVSEAERADLDEPTWAEAYWQVIEEQRESAMPSDEDPWVERANPGSDA